MDFTPITINTQEELDKMFQERVERAKRAEAAKFEGYDDYKAKAEKYDTDITDLNDKLSAANQTIENNKATIADLQTKVHTYEKDAVKAKVCAEFGLAPELASRLNGDDEKALRADAQVLQQLVGVQKHTAPLANPDGKDDGEDTRSALKNTLKHLRKE